MRLLKRERYRLALSRRKGYLPLLAVHAAGNGKRLRDVGSYDRFHPAFRPAHGRERSPRAQAYSLYDALVEAGSGERGQQTHFTRIRVDERFVDYARVAYGVVGAVAAFRIRRVVGKQAVVINVAVHQPLERVRKRFPVVQTRGYQTAVDERVARLALAGADFHRLYRRLFQQDALRGFEK